MRDTVTKGEAMEILSDKKAVKRIKKAKRQIKQGKTISLTELRHKIEGEKNV